jgi:hypothetical protein
MRKGDGKENALCVERKKMLMTLLLKWRKTFLSRKWLIN